MVRVEMLTVGRELLIGRTVNTNALWAGGRLARLGTMLSEIVTVDDELGEIAEAFRSAIARRPEFLVVVGGLGPTPDDMTLRGIAKGLGVGLGVNGEALALMKEHYRKIGMEGIELTEARMKMVTLPDGATALSNATGTAPGAKFMVGKTLVFSLPGVPSEMKEMFRRHVEPEVKGKLGSLHRAYSKFMLEGVFESALAPTIGEALRHHPGAYVKSHPRGVRGGVSRIELDIAVVSEDKAWTEKETSAIASEILGEVVKGGGKMLRKKGERGRT